MIDLSRSAALLGGPAMERLGQLHVAVVGVGGVGSWCAEALARTGVGRLTLVDDDVVAPSNLNRQCPATAKALGQPKVEAMAARLHEIRPELPVVVRKERYPDGEAAQCLWDADLVVDAIDSIGSKAQLILSATAGGVPVISSMGAARRLDPTKVTVRRFDRVEGDGLARALRQWFKRNGRYPTAKFDCVCSTEAPSGEGLGSIMPVTAAFGMALASWVIAKVVEGKLS